MYSGQGSPSANYAYGGGGVVNYHTNNSYGNQVMGGAPNNTPTLCYQVDFNSVAVGKVVAMSKRRIRWRFGFPNRTSLDAGKSGIDCRGEEHDVNLIWSITSGKKMIMSNGQQIYTGLNKSRIFEYAWHNKNGTHLRILAHSTMPMGSAQGTRQYDLFIDGKSFFNMPKVYEIGLKGSTIDDTRIPGVITDSQRGLMDQFGPQRVQMGYSPSGRNIVAPASAEEEEDDLKRAIEESLKETRSHLATKGRLDEQSIAASTLTNTIIEQPSSNQPEEPLIDLLGESTPVVPNTQAMVPVAGAQSQYQVDPFSFQPMPPPTAAPVMPPPAPVRMDEFTPQAPSYNDISSQILMGYSPAGAPHPGAPALMPPTEPYFAQASVATTNPSVSTTNPFDDDTARTATSTNPFDAPAPTPSFAAPAGYDYQQQQQVPYQQQNATNYGANNAYQQQPY